MKPTPPPGRLERNGSFRIDSRCQAMAAPKWYTDHKARQCSFTGEWRWMGRPICTVHLRAVEEVGRKHIEWCEYRSQLAHDLNMNAGGRGTT